DLNISAADNESDPFQYLTEVYQYYLPAQIIVSAAITAVFTYIVALLIMRRYGFEIPQGPAFSDMQLPWYSIWGLIIGLGLYLLGEEFSWLVAKIGKNLLFVLASLYFIMGISVLVHYYKKLQIHLLIKILFLLTLLVFYPFSFVILLLIGALDPLVNFRRLPVIK
ncbi:MAG: YybS family protein, partial [Peptococcaceae bacterium]|nr:YybS family protein [Peptococcaceae bacterium]